MQVTLHGEVIVKSTGFFTNIIFKNLDEPEEGWYRYVTVTIPPGWNVVDLKKGDVGYITYEPVTAGDEYYCSQEKKFKKYEYSNYYFVKFVKGQENINTEFKF